MYFLYFNLCCPVLLNIEISVYYHDCFMGNDQANISDNFAAFYCFTGRVFIGVWASFYHPIDTLLTLMNRLFPALQKTGPRAQLVLAYCCVHLIIFTLPINNPSRTIGHPTQPFFIQSWCRIIQVSILICG